DEREARPAGRRRLARAPAVDRRRGDPEQLGKVGDEGEVGGLAPGPGLAPHARVEHPPPDRSRQASLERDAEGLEREREQAALPHRRHPRASVDADERYAGDAARLPRGPRAARDDGAGLALAQIAGLPALEQVVLDAR